jgi:hypothetical protein
MPSCNGSLAFFTEYLVTMTRLHPDLRSLLDEIEAFCKMTGDSPTQFGLKAMHDSHFVSRLRQGRDIRHKTEDKVRKFIRNKTVAAKRFNGHE